MKSAIVALAATSLALLTSCSSEPERSTYCVQETGSGQQVVDEDLCNGDHDGYMLIVLAGVHHYNQGSYIKTSHVKDAKLIKPNDSKARSNAGLSKSGTVKNGTVPKPTSGGNVGGGAKPAPARPAPPVRVR